METKELISTQFTELNATTKDLINNGLFFLYSVTIPNKENVKFMLSTEKAYYLISENGTVLERISSADSVQINERILFSDIKKETSTNKLFNISWAL